MGKVSTESSRAWERRSLIRRAEESTSGVTCAVTTRRPVASLGKKMLLSEAHDKDKSVMNSLSSEKNSFGTIEFHTRTTRTGAIISWDVWTWKCRNCSKLFFGEAKWWEVVGQSVGQFYNGWFSVIFPRFSDLKQIPGIFEKLRYSSWDHEWNSQVLFGFSFGRDHR